MPTFSPSSPATGAHSSTGRRAADGSDMEALLAMLEERRADPPSLKALARSSVMAAAPRVAVTARRVAAADRRLADAASVAALFMLVSTLAVLVVVAETTFRAVAACDLPGRGRACARGVAAWDLPGRARSWSGRARVWADHILAWPMRVDRPI